MHLWCRRIAAAGRSEPKLQAVVADLPEGAQPSILSGADVSTYSTLARMARQARIVISCVGPYRHYGEPVVRACVEAETDYLDVCGEPGEHPHQMPMLCDLASFRWWLRARQVWCLCTGLCGSAHKMLQAVSASQASLLLVPVHTCLSDDFSAQINTLCWPQHFAMQLAATANLRTQRVRTAQP